MTLLRTVTLGFAPIGLIKENANYIVCDYTNSRFKWFDNNFTLLRSVLPGFGPRGIIKEGATISYAIIPTAR